MTEPITDDNFYNEHAGLLGHVALAWNDCHGVVLSIFHTLSGVSWRNAGGGAREGSQSPRRLAANQKASTTLRWRIIERSLSSSIFLALKSDHDRRDSCVPCSLRS